MRKSRAGREKFHFPRRPPYANGDIHIGHALNKTLKDMVVRTRRCWARTCPTCPAGTVTACRSSGRSRSSTAKKLNKDEVPIKEFTPSAAPMPSIG